MKKLEIVEMQNVEGGWNWGCVLSEAGLVVGTIGMASSPATNVIGLACAFVGYGIACSSIALSCG